MPISWYCSLSQPVRWGRPWRTADAARHKHPNIPSARAQEILNYHHAAFSRLPVLPKQIKSRSSPSTLESPASSLSYSMEANHQGQGLLKPAQSPPTLICPSHSLRNPTNEQTVGCLLLDATFSGGQDPLPRDENRIYAFSRPCCRIFSAVLQAFLNFSFLHANYGFLVFCQNTFKMQSRQTSLLSVQVLTNFND